MRDFHNKHSFIIKTVNKSSAITIKSRDDYSKDSLEHLSDRRTYLPLDEKSYLQDIGQQTEVTLVTYKRGGLQNSTP